MQTSMDVKESELITEEEKAETAHTVDQHVGEKAVPGKTSRPLHAEVIATSQKHNVRLVPLAQQMTQLESNFTAARKLCS